MADERDKFRRALDFMNTLGVSHAVVTPLLKRLLKLYDDEWSLIEEENYRALADCYFEQVESKEDFRVDVPRSQIVTRNRARQAEVNGGMPSQSHSQRKKSDSMLAQGDELNTSAWNSLALVQQIESGSHKESRTGKAKAPMGTIPQKKLKVQTSVPVTTAQPAMETFPQKKLKVQTSVPATTAQPAMDIVFRTSSALVVKQEPVEDMHDWMAREEPTLSQLPERNTEVPHIPPLSIAAPILQQNKKSVINHEDNFERVVLNTIKPASQEAMCDVYTRKKCKKETAGSSSHSSRSRITVQEEDALSAIAATYRNMSDEVEVGHEIRLSDTHQAPIVLRKDIQGRSNGETRLDAVVKQELQILFDEKNSQPPALVQRTDFRDKQLLREKGIGVVKEEPEYQYREAPVPPIPMRKVSRKKTKDSGILDHSASLKQTHQDKFHKTDRLAIVLQHPQQNRWDDIRSHKHNLDDISRGQERVPISVVNDLTDDNLPETFYYISKSITYQNAYVNFSLARIVDEDCCGTCYGDCLKSYPPCHCARETGGEFAYDSDGCLRQSFLQETIEDKRSMETISNHTWYCEKGTCPLEWMKNDLNPEPCKGHLMRKFVKECWSKCGCDMQCGNRVVQKGISYKLQVFFISKGKGWGVRTLEDLPAGAFVCEYVGEILTNIELDGRNGAVNHSDHYPVLLDADWSSENTLQDEELLCLDATYYGNVARFINHRCYDANLVDIPVEIESPDRHYYHVAFFTTRSVKAFEELTWDYCIDFEDSDHPIKAFQCLCESKYCRGKQLKMVKFCT